MNSILKLNKQQAIEWEKKNFSLIERFVRDNILDPKKTFMTKHYIKYIPINQEFTLSNYKYNLHIEKIGMFDYVIITHYRVKKNR